MDWKCNYWGLTWKLSVHTVERWGGNIHCWFCNQFASQGGCQKCFRNQSVKNTHIKTMHKDIIENYLTFNWLSMYPMPIWNQYPSLLSPQDPVQYSTILSSLHIIYFHLNLRLHSFWAEGNPRRRRPKTNTNTQDPRPILHNIAFTWVGFGNCRRSKLVRTKMLSLFTLNSDNQNDKNPKWKRHKNSQSNRWHQKYSTVRSKNFRKLKN